MNKLIIQKKSWDKWSCWIGTILIAAGLCYAQVHANRMLLTVSLVGFLLFILWACSKELAMPVLMFFLPWSTIMKLYSGGTSFFTLALLEACLFFYVKREFAVYPYQLFCVIMIGIQTLLAKAIQNNSIETNYLCFVILLFLFPLIAKNSAHLDFRQVTLFFAAGIISAALTAQRFADIPNVSQYVKVYAYQNITRWCGYYGDPNFYSAQITACLAGILTLLTYEKNLRQQLLMTVVVLVLIYCGLLSGSKSFMVVSVCLFLIWSTILLEKNRRGTSRFQLVAGAVIVLLIILSSSAFGTLLQVINERFAYRSTMSSLTTGRTDLWSSYLREFSKNPVLMLIGQGYSHVTLNGGKASHNTIIQGIYQFGVLGFPWIIVWMVCLGQKLMRGIKGKRKVKKYIGILGIGIILPWMGLDILFFDEFFLFPIYLIMGIKYSVEKGSLLEAGVNNRADAVENKVLTAEGIKQSRTAEEKSRGTL